MKKIRILCLMLSLCAILCLLSGCARKEEKKSVLTVNSVLAFADSARDVSLTYFSKYDYVQLGSNERPLYYFQLNDPDYSLSVGLDENGEIESMLFSHISGEEIYLFHKNPGQLDPNATQYTEDASSYDLQNFIDKMMEN